jgi:hypothetical protein
MGSLELDTESQDQGSLFGVIDQLLQRRVILFWVPLKRRLPFWSSLFFSLLFTAFFHLLRRQFQSRSSQPVLHL